MTTLTDLLTPGAKALHPYQPGKPVSDLAREMGLDPASIVKLASNENPLGPSPMALAAMQDVGSLSRYPDGGGFELRQTLAEQLEVEAAQITLGNGSSDLLDFVTRIFVQPGDNIVVSEHAFSLYGLNATAVSAEVREAPAKNFGHDLDAMAAQVDERTRLVFITNPNNPTGTWLSEAEIRGFLAQLPAHVITILDEAYFEFVDEAEYPNGVRLLADFPRLLVTRTFSKAYGLAALRVGFGVSSSEMAALLNRVRPPFNVNAPAQAAAVAAVKDQAHVQRSITANRLGMKQLIGAFEQLGLDYLPSVGNFICVRLQNAVEINQALLRRGVIVRALGGYGMPEYLRVSIGTEAENKRFIDMLTEVLQQGEAV
ncbi:histidinol-phosphate aminotransferase 2 [Bacterioplanes sanyensis]|uniref:histidinol-phosphate transaminase n=1 Tax=Bacterioplanes sanyensis TaxID=1249553 RepID=UPI0019BBDBBB|nr:histidinol-phosphate transaminase [Bacterioplanes sanyensis]GGY32276.1 histidinol-phosphate aminotransferase 2 [Bacterioplanes sanyensis]